MLGPILDLHFDPVYGSRYWIELLQERDLRREDFQTYSDLWKLGPMDVTAMRNRPIADFIPLRLHNRLPHMLLSETGGNTGDPCRRVYLPEEFENAFVAPWLAALDRFNFPRKGCWLFVGPSGPHVIAQAARAFARATGSLEPFSIDCDVRWVRQQQPGSLGNLLYMEHLANQAMNIISRQEITVLFTTPPLLLTLAKRMNEKQRCAITGIHTGGMAQSTEVTKQLHDLFPQAVILPGYGNSLFGVTFEKEQLPGEASIFYVHDPALRIQLIPLPQTQDEEPQLTKEVAAGQRGRILFHRFDRSFLILNMLERDTAIRIEKDKDTGFGDVKGLSFHQGSEGEVY